ncbi:hypothetical protein [Nostoc sp.]
MDKNIYSHCEAFSIYSGATRSDRAIIPHREIAVSISDFYTS